MGKCKFFNICKHACLDNVCMRDDGDYYGFDRKAGCYRSLAEFGEKSIYHINYINPKKKILKKQKKPKVS